MHVRIQGLIQWEPKCLLRTIIGRKEREAKWNTNGWVPIQLLNLLERAYIYALEAADNPGGVIDRVHAWHTVKAIFISISFCVS